MPATAVDRIRMVSLAPCGILEAAKQPDMPVELDNGPWSNRPNERGRTTSKFNDMVGQLDSIRTRCSLADLLSLLVPSLPEYSDTKYSCDTAVMRVLPR
jgi:hypothetical protein